MGYIVLYFGIGAALAILLYLYSCYDYKVNFNNWSWEQYTNNKETHQFMCAIFIIYPFIIIVLTFVGLWWCIGYIMEYVREWIFKIIDQHFIK